MQVNATSGQGNATLGVTVARNELGTSRTGAVAVNNQRVTVTQQPRPCTYALRASPQNFSSSGGRGSISIETLTGCAWTASSSAEWLRLSTTAGSGTGSAEFEATVNDGGPRQGTISINGQGVTITQDGRGQPGGGGGTTCSISLSTASINAAAAGGTHTVVVAATSGCDWTATTNAPSWLMVAPGGGRGNGSLTLTVARNTGSARTGTVAVGDQSVTVNQAAAPACTITIDSTSAVFSHTGGEGRVRVTTQDTCTWSVTGGTQWAQVTAPTGTATNSGDVRYTVAPNNGAQRSTTLSIGGQNHVITQEAMPAPTCSYTLSSNSQDFTAAGGTHTFTVTTQQGCTWTANSNQGWAQITATTSNSVTYSVPPNDGGPRQGTITVTGASGGSAQHNVTQQAPAPTCTFQLQPTSQDFPHTGGNNTFTVTTQPGCTWTANSNQGWARITSSSGSSPVSYTVDANSGGARQASITVSGTSGGSSTFTVTQQPQPAPTCTFQLQPNSQDFPHTGGTQTVTVTTQQACTWTASSNQGWAQITGTSANSFSYSVPQNGGGPRQATITVTGTSGGSASHSVTQQPQPAPTCTYSVQPGSHSFPANGGSNFFDVNTQPNCNWSPQAGDNWVNINSGSGSGPARVTYTVSPNSSTSSRSTSISISNSNVSHSITQAGVAPTCTYNLQPGSQQSTAAGGTFSFTVSTQSGCSWTASGGANWITNVTQSGNSVSYTVQANNSGAQRQASITVSGGGGSASHTVTQSQ